MPGDRRPRASPRRSRTAAPGKAAPARRKTARGAAASAEATKAAHGAAQAAPAAAGSAAWKTPAWVERLLAQARRRGERKAAALRVEHPGERPRQLGERLVKTSAFRAGLAGAVTGTLALVTLPVGLPAGVALALLLEAELLFALLALYGLSGEGEQGRLRLTALWAGAGFADAAKSAGLKLGAEALGRALAGSLPARIIARLNPALLRAVLRRLGLGWLPRAARLWPLLGAPLAFALDRAALRTLGAAALATLDSVRREAAEGRPATTEGAPAE